MNISYMNICLNGSSIVLRDYVVAMKSAHNILTKKAIRFVP